MTSVPAAGERGGGRIPDTKAERTSCTEKWQDGGKEYDESGMMKKLSEIEVGNKLTENKETNRE